MAFAAGTRSWAAKNASRGDITLSGITVQAVAGTIGRAAPRCSSIARMTSVTILSTFAAVSAKVMTGAGKIAVGKLQVDAPLLQHIGNHLLHHAGTGQGQHYLGRVVHQQRGQRRVIFTADHAQPRTSRAGLAGDADGVAQEVPRRGPARAAARSMEAKIAPGGLVVCRPSKAASEPLPVDELALGQHHAKTG